MLLLLIIACEISFWVFLLLGLAARYLFRWRRFSATLLLCVPLSDLVLFFATILHLHSGVTADQTDGLAAAYLGVSVAFGKSMIRWADARFSQRWAFGPPVPPPPRYGRARARYEWQVLRKAVLAWASSCVLLLGGSCSSATWAEPLHCWAG